MSHCRVGLKAGGPKRRRRHFSYNESVDEGPGLIEKESVEVEEAVPADENEPLESIDEGKKREPPVFEQ